MNHARSTSFPASKAFDAKKIARSPQRKTFSDPAHRSVFPSTLDVLAEIIQDEIEFASVLKTLGGHLSDGKNNQVMDAISAPLSKITQLHTAFHKSLTFLPEDEKKDQDLKGFQLDRGVRSLNVLCSPQFSKNYKLYATRLNEVWDENPLKRLTLEPIRRLESLRNSLNTMRTVSNRDEVDKACVNIDLVLTSVPLKDLADLYRMTVIMALERYFMRKGIEFEQKQILRWGTIKKLSGMLRKPESKVMLLFKDRIVWISPQIVVGGFALLSDSNAVASTSPSTFAVKTPVRVFRFSCTSQISHSMWMHHMKQARLDMPLEEGEVFGGYRLKDMLDKSKNSLVYKCVSEKDKSIHVAKLLIRANADLEAEMHLACKHDAIVSAKERLGPDTQNRIWLIQEYCTLGSLEKILSSVRFNEQQIAFIALNILKALGFLHNRGIVHRDIKPANILLTLEGAVKLTDFGVAFKLNSEDENEQFATAKLAGTPYYLAPELLDRDRHNVGSGIDIWSLGISLIQLAEGKPPYEGLAAIDAMQMVMRSKPPVLENSKKQWSCEFEEFLSRCLEKDEMNRSSSMSLLEHPFLHKASASSMQDVVRKLLDHIDEEDTKQSSSVSEEMERFRRNQGDALLIEARRSLPWDSQTMSHHSRTFSLEDPNCSTEDEMI